MRLLAGCSPQPTGPSLAANSDPPRVQVGAAGDEEESRKNIRRLCIFGISECLLPYDAHWEQKHAATLGRQPDVKSLLRRIQWQAR
jgi:hypothetical protein